MSKRNTKKHQMRRVVATVCGTPWAIKETKLQEIAEFLNLRAQGVTFSEAELEERYDATPLMERTGLQISMLAPAEKAPPLSYAITEAGVALIPLDGVMGPKMNLIMRYSGGTSTERFAALVRAAADNPDVKSIVLPIDSPGGSVLGLENAADAVKEAAAKKRVVAAVTGLMCSAAYYVGSAADEIVAAADAEIGSIGTVCVHVESSRADAKAGLKYTVIKQGRFKWAANQYEPLPKDGRDAAQEEVDAYYAAFVGRVAANQGITPERVEAEYGQGKSFIATRALEIGMIDRLGNLVDVIQRMSEPTTSPAGITQSIERGNQSMSTNSTPTAPDAGDQTPNTASERSRILEIQAIGEIMGVNAAIVDQAIDAGTTEDAFRRIAIENVRQERPVGMIQSGAASADKFGAAAVDALGSRCGLEPSTPIETNPLQFCSLSRLCEESLRLANGGRQLVGSPEDHIVAALQGGTPGTMVVGASTAGGVPYQSPGSFPNILSGLANKVLLEQFEFNPATCTKWAVKLPSVPDFKPSTILRAGEFGKFPVHIDGDDFDQSDISEAYSWIQVDSFGDEFGLTPVMIANDDLGAFSDALRDKRLSHEMTLNRLCVNLLTSNPVLPDGVELFHADHGNLIPGGSGGVPSETELSDMRLLLRQQTGVGGRRKLGLGLALVLAPEALETTVEKLLKATLQTAPATTSDLNVFRGTDYEIEPMLTDNSAAGWYGFAPKAARTKSIVYIHQRGYEKMVTRHYFNPKNNCRFFQFEGRFAAAIGNHRGVAKNAGA